MRSQCADRLELAKRVVWMVTLEAEHDMIKLRLLDLL